MARVWGSIRGLLKGLYGSQKFSGPYSCINHVLAKIWRIVRCTCITEYKFQNVYSEIVPDNEWPPLRARFERRPRPTAAAPLRSKSSVKSRFKPWLGDKSPLNYDALYGVPNSRPRKGDKDLRLQDGACRNWIGLSLGAVVTNLPGGQFRMSSWLEEEGEVWWS